MTTREEPPLGPDTPAQGEPRRAFLIRLARSTAFVPPLMLSYELAAAQGTQPPGLISKVKKNPSTTTTLTVDETVTQPPPGVSESSTYGGTAPWSRPPPER